MDRQAKAIVKAAEQAGWTLVAHQRHLKLRCGCGSHTVIIACTGGWENRSRRNEIALLESQARLGSCALPKHSIKRV
jgi:hypothetical protein